MEQKCERKERSNVQKERDEMCWNQEKERADGIGYGLAACWCIGDQFRCLCSGVPL